MNKFFSLILCLSILLNPKFVQADAVDAYRTEGTGSSDGNEFYNKLAVTTAVAISGANMFTCLTAGLSHIVFAAASVDFINAEIDFAKTATAYHQRKLESLKVDESKIGPHGYVAGEKDIQLPALKAAKAEEENTKSVLEKRKSKISKVIDWYDVAVVWAWTEVLIQSTVCFTLWKSHYYEKIRDAYNETEQKIAVATAANGLDKAGYLKLLQDETDEAFKTSVWAVMTGPGKAIYFNNSKKRLKEVRSGFEERINLAQANIDKLDAAIKAFEAQTAPSDTEITGAPVVASNNSGPSVTPSSNYNQTDLATSGNKDKKYVCKGSPSTGGVNTSKTHCGSNNIKFSGNLASLRPGFHSTATNGLAYAEAILNGDAAGAEMATAIMGANAAKMKDMQAEIMNDINANRLKNGQGKIDFDSLIKAKDKEIDARFAAVAAKNGFGSGMGSGSGIRATIDPDSVSKSTSKSATVPAARAGGAELPKVDPFASSTTDAGINETGLTAAETEAVAESIEQNKNEYLSNNADSLFEVVSKTYVRNFDRILVRKKKVLEEAPKTEAEQ
jgi:hypothetical protein